MPSNRLILCRPLLLPSISPSIRVFSKESVLCIRWPKYWSSTLASVLPMNIQDWFPSGLTGVGSPCSPRDSQGSSPTPQFKSINSSALSFLYSPTLTSIHDHWKNPSFDKSDCQGSPKLPLILILVIHWDWPCSLLSFDHVTALANLHVASLSQGKAQDPRWAQLELI